MPQNRSACLWYSAVVDSRLPLGFGKPIVTVRLPDGELQRFRARAFPECTPLVPQVDVELRFESLPDTYSKLEQIEFGTVRVTSQNQLVASVAVATRTATSSPCKTAPNLPWTRASASARRGNRRHNADNRHVGRVTHHSLRQLVRHYRALQKGGHVHDVVGRIPADIRCVFARFASIQ
jgi:hypothetical protein